MIYSKWRGTTSELSEYNTNKAVTDRMETKAFSALHKHSRTCFMLMPVWIVSRGRDSAIAFSDRIKSGVVGEQLWLQIKEPTEKDMGKYAIEFNDGKGGLRRSVELSGQGEARQQTSHPKPRSSAVTLTLV